MRALLRFSVQYSGVRIAVRLLPSINDVHREYERKYIDGCRLRRAGKSVEAFFCMGSMVLPSGGDLLELIPHEVTHAVEYARPGCAEEMRATLVGILSSRIHRRIARVYYI